ncbi:MAG TPA: tripartite tricarboxylate transporter substrate binding protein [Burkholderiales bacterium]|nr:tripartite tricarboxylate transporter substrate binding protein [Burkholderiales bacterium]
MRLHKDASRTQRAQLSCAVLLIAATGLPAAWAQSYPARPIRLLVASGPGGGQDFVARLVAPALTERMGQSIVVDNRAGATGSIAAELASRAAPDGYTLLVMSASLVVYGAVNRTRYDLVGDFTPLSQITAAPYVLIAHPTLPVTSVPELIAYAKAHPRKLNYFSTGNASFVHLATEWFRTEAGIDLVHVPYKGLGAAYPDLLAGRVQFGFGSPAFVMPHVRSQTLRPLAITSEARAKTLPDLPTMIEAGMPGFVVSQWIGLLAPRGTPQAIVERLHREIVTALQQPDVTSRLAREGLDALGTPPREFAAHLKSEHETWVRVIKRAGIRAE